MCTWALLNVDSLPSPVGLDTTLGRIQTSIYLFFITVPGLFSRFCRMSFKHITCVCMLIVGLFLQRLTLRWVSFTSLWSSSDLWCDVCFGSAYITFSLHWLRWGWRVEGWKKFLPLFFQGEGFCPIFLKSINRPALCFPANRDNKLLQQTGVERERERERERVKTQWQGH